jgi:DNA primase
MNDREDPELLDEALEQIGINTQYDWQRINCPYCVFRTGKADKRQSMGLRLDSGFAHCFKCNVRTKTKKLESLSLESLQIRLPKLEEDVKIGPPANFRELNKNSLDHENEEAFSYLIKRGITESQIEGIGIGSCYWGHAAGRVVVPIKNKQGEWVGWVGRDWTGDAPLRYMYPKGFRRELHVFNEAALFRQDDSPVMVVEGVFDAIPYWPNAVAVLGKPANNHSEIIAKTKRRVAVCLDGDAWEAGWAFARKLRMRGCVTAAVRLPPDKDPGNIGTDVLRKMVQEADYG